MSRVDTSQHVTCQRRANCPSLSRSPVAKPCLGFRTYIPATIVHWLLDLSEPNIRKGNFQLASMRHSKSSRHRAWPDITTKRTERGALREVVLDQYLAWVLSHAPPDKELKGGAKHAHCGKRHVANQQA